MASTIVFNGTSYSIPAEADSNWADNVSNYLIAIASGALQKTGGSFTLTSEVDFGATYGLKSAYFKSRATNPSSSGQVRLGNTESVSWRNAANSADLSLNVNSSDALVFNGTSLTVGGTQVQTAISVSDTSTIDLNLSGSDISGSVKAASLDNSHIAVAAAIAYSKLNLSGSIVNADVSSSAAIAYSKLNLSSSVVNADISASAAIALSKLATVSASKALVSDASGYVSASTVTSTELGYVSGVTSSIQTQINAKQDSATAVTLTGSQTLTNKTLTAPVINSPTGLVKADVGLGNVDNTSDATKNSAVATLTNKTLTTPVMDVMSLTEQASTPATPSSGTLKMYAKTDNKLYYLNPSGTEQQVGSGAGFGSINYISNPDAETDTSGWATFADGSSLVDGTGGSPTATFARSTSSPLRGSASFLYTPGTLGNGASYDFTIAAADRAKVLRASFDFAVSGTISLGDYQVYIYDVTNSTLIQPAPFKLEGTSGTNYTFSGSFQTSSSSTSYRLIIWQSVSTAVTLKLDNVSVGPQVVSIGGYIGDWQTYTPTAPGFWTGANVTYSGSWRRVGDSAEVHVRIVLGGAPPSTTLSGITLPTGLVIDTNKLIGGQNTVTSVGTARLFDSAGGLGSGTYNASVVYGSTTTVRVMALAQASSSDHYDRAVDQATPFTFASGDEIQLEIKVPIVGWGTSQVLSSETDTRIVSARAYKSVTQSIPDSSITTITFDTISHDTHGKFNTSTGVFTAPVPGYYNFGAVVSWANSASILSGNRLGLYYKVNGGTPVQINFVIFSGSVSESPAISGADTVKLNAGDTLEISYLQDTSGAQNIGGGTSTNVWINRLAGPAQIAASETVSCSYQANASQSITSTAVLTIFGTKMHDTHSAYNSGTGIFTTPVSGKFRISMQALTVTATSPPNNINIRKNSVAVVRANPVYLNQASQYLWNTSITMDLKAGDTIDFQIVVSTAGSTYNSSLDCFFSIERIGN